MINMFHLEELAEKTGTPAKTIELWLKEELFTPVGKTADSIPVFSEESLQSVAKINSLLELGYKHTEIKKIIKKVGLPESKKIDNRQFSDKENFLTVGNLAEKTNLSPRTLKHWEEKGIIEPDLRSNGGFRLYRNYYILFCNLIKDLQLFGYTLDQIKIISDYFRDFIDMRDNLESLDADEVENNLVILDDEILQLYEKMDLLKNGIKRWEDLLKKQKKQILLIKEKNKKRLKKETKND
ncbi:MAG: MerR family transcriptional regulator [Spirochaetales bacterium]|nr:MerR family transcriptional regulator [Spirochaetales bacterium]